MRHAIYRIGMVCMAAVVLAACTPYWSDSADDNGIVLDLWYWNRSIEPELFREFERQNPGITVNDQLIGGSYGAKVRTTLAGQAFVPDVLAFNEDIATYFPNSDQFVDLYDYGAAEVESEYLPWKWQAGVTPDGKMIGFPMDTGPSVLFYRADLFEQAGLPSDPADVAAQLNTWDAYFAAGTQLQQALPGVKMISSSTDIYTQVRRQHADLYVTADDVYIGDGPTIQRAWDLAIQASQLDLTANSNNSTSDWNAGVSTGTIASFPGAVWMKQILQDAAPATAGNWRVAPLPDGPGNQGGSFLGITDASPHKAEAWALIEFVQSPASQLTAYQTLNLYPAAIAPLQSQEANQPDPFYGDQNTNEIFSAAALEVPNFYFSPADNVINPIFTLELSNAVLLGKDPDEAWADAQEQIKRELDHKMPWVIWEDT